MERVKIGEEYWFIKTNDYGYLIVDCTIETDSLVEQCRHKNNNYFHTREQAGLAIDKILAVLAGAEVIEMPSGEECETFAVELARREAFVSETFSTIADWRTASKMTTDWLKSKIVK